MEKAVVRTEGDEGEAGWQQLHAPLLNLIMQGLPFADRIRAAGVCRWWRQAGREGKEGPIRPNLPWLVHRNASAHPATHTIFSHDGRQRDVDVPATRSKDFMGSAYGWMLYACKQTQECFLLNPVTNSRIDLPPRAGRSPNSTPAFISADPSTADLETVVVMLMSDNSLVFCRPTDEQWTSVTTYWPHYYHTLAIADMVACKGKIYMLFDLGRFGCLHVGPHLSMTWFMVDHPGVPTLPRRSTRFLVESSGDVLLVTDHNRSVNGRQLFDVYRADLEGSAWVPAPDLRGRRLFLGRFCSMSSPCPETAGRGVGYPGDDLKYWEDDPIPLGDMSSSWTLKLASMESNWFWMLPSF